MYIGKSEVSSRFDRRRIEDGRKGFSLPSILKALRMKREGTLLLSPRMIDEKPQLQEAYPVNDIVDAS